MHQSRCHSLHYHGFDVERVEWLHHVKNSRVIGNALSHTRALTMPAVGKSLLLLSLGLEAENCAQNLLQACQLGHQAQPVKHPDQPRLERKRGRLGGVLQQRRDVRPQQPGEPAPQICVKMSPAWAVKLKNATSDNNELTCPHRLPWQCTAPAGPPRRQSGQSRCPSRPRTAATGSCRSSQSR